MGCTGSKKENSSSKGQKKKVVQKLSEKDLKVLVKESGFTREEIKEIFDKFSEKSVNGKLNKKQFVKLYSKLRPESHRKLAEISEHAFNAFDINHDKTISFQEFVLSFSVTSRGDVRSKLEKTFECYDSDGNGYIDAKEIESVLAAMITLLDGDKNDDVSLLAKKCMEDLDISGDNMISKDEFVNGLMKNFALRSIMSPFN